MDDPQASIVERFVELVLQSPPAIVCLVLSTFIGYGLAYVLLVHGRENPPKLGTLLNVALGLGFTAIVFVVSNFDIIGRDLTAEQISDRAPFTLLIAFAVSFVVLVGAMMRGGRR